MSGFDLSEEQKQVVENRGGALLVSAAAGSGKTRVLVDRLFRHITEDKNDVTDFLIITFTRAAASELRGRIAKELNARLAADSNNRHLRRQLLLVHRAEIKTIDAFCSSLVRENVHLLPEDGQGHRLTSDARTMDEQEATALKARVMEKVLEDYYAEAEAGEGDTALADCFGFGRDDGALVQLIGELFLKVQSHAFPERWIEENRRRWRELSEETCRELYAAPLQKQLAVKARHAAKSLRKWSLDMERTERIAACYGESFSDAADSLDALARVAETGEWDAVAAFPACFGTLKSYRTRKGEDGELSAEEEAGKQEADRYKGLWKATKDSMTKALKPFSVPFATRMEELRSVAPLMEKLLTLTEDFSRRYREEKIRRNITDFSDQEHDALRLLCREDGTQTELGKEISARYTEVMVDEYQDTNEVQDRLFAAVSSEGKNLFVVGDVKQSIYRFRLADPTIFLEKYKRYADAKEAEEGMPRKIVLSRNYRSRNEVLQAVNFVFRNILSEEFGEMNYGEEEALHLGKTDYVSHEDSLPEFCLLDFTPGEDDGIRTAKRHEAEARYVAERIDRMLREGFPVQDGDGRLRPVRPEDFAILLRAATGMAPLYRSALAERNIPCAAESSDVFFETLEIAVTFQILQIIDNPHQDVPLISVLSSPVFGFTPDDLARIRAGAGEGDFFTALMKKQDDERVRVFTERLREVRLLAKDRSVSALLSYLYDEWNLLGIFGACAGGRERRRNLMLLLQYVETLEASGYRGLFALTNELRERIASGNPPKTPSGGETNGVRILSIHKSKGLEFPVVILADLGHRFNISDYSDPVLVHPQMGLGPRAIDLKLHIRYPTLADLAVKARLEQEAKAEELRVLYVAMTRAKEKLIMVASMKDFGKYLKKQIPKVSLPVEPGTLADASAFADWLILALLARKEAEPLYDFAELERKDAPYADETPWRIRVENLLPYAEAYRGKAREKEESTEKVSLSFDPELLDFVYPHLPETTMPTVLSATAIADSDAAARTPHRREMTSPAFLSPGKKLTGAEAGTATHLLMQYIDFSTQASETALQEELQRLRREGRMTAEQTEAVRVDEVLRFLESPLAEELRRAKRVEREYQFSLLTEARRYAPEAGESETLLLHGVMDCWYETEKGETVLLDFKTDRVFGDALTARAEAYRRQIEVYDDALLRIEERKAGRKYLYFFSEGKMISVL